MQIVIKAEDTDSAHFVATYNHPCVLQSYGNLRLHRMRETTAHAMPIRTCAGTTGDGSNTFFNKMLLLWPAVVLWGCGTAVGVEEGGVRVKFEDEVLDPQSGALLRMDTQTLLFPVSALDASDQPADGSSEAQEGDSAVVGTASSVVSALASAHRVALTASLEQLRRVRPSALRAGWESGDGDGVEAGQEDGAVVSVIDGAESPEAFLNRNSSV